MSSTIQIKGLREGLLVTVGEGDWPDVLELILSHLEQQQGFLKGAKLYLDVGNLILNAVDLGHLRDRISELGLTLWGVLSNSPKTESTAQLLGLATRISQPSRKTQYRNIAAADTSQIDGESAIMVKRTLRSGFRIKNDGNVVVVGDINPGAEIIAGGSIFVWGHLRGVVHAGADGDETVTVCALDLSPAQIRIANQIFMVPQRQSKSQPEIARILNGRIVVEAWNPGKK
jgi:septum site-determining protein MinC